MKEITCQEITETLKTMCIEAATNLPKDVINNFIKNMMKKIVYLLRKHYKFLLIMLILQEKNKCQFVKIQEWLLFM